jgi:glycosyltransferase involved in cell wall biosynthesis
VTRGASLRGWTAPDLTLVSVVVPAYNAGDLLLQQVNAVLDQDYDGAYEVVVADNRSTDGSIEQLLGLHVRVVDAPERQSIGYARGAGVAAAEGELVALCDADDVVHRSWLRGLVAAARHAPAVTGPGDMVTLNPPAIARRRPNEVGIPVYCDFQPFARGYNMACWKAVIDLLDGWDESFVLGEDVDMSWRLIEHGGWIGYAEDAWVSYRARPTPAGLFHQFYSYGKGDVDLYARYRAKGMRRRPVTNLLRNLVVDVVQSPLFRRDPVDRMMWALRVGLICGRAVRSAQRRLIFL